MDCGGDSGDEGRDIVVLSSRGIGETIATFPMDSVMAFFKVRCLACGCWRPSSENWWLVSLYLVGPSGGKDGCGGSKRFVKFSVLDE